MNAETEQPRIRRRQLAPAVMGESMAQAMPPRPRDFQAAHDRLGAMCGHGALAAALGISAYQACSYFPNLSPERGWVNLPDMERAMTNAGVRWHSTRDQWPTQHGKFLTGLVDIQFIGSWLDPGVPPGAACRQTHWIATSGALVYDINLGEWVRRDRWEYVMASELRAALSPKSTGFRVKRGYEIATGLLP